MELLSKTALRALVATLLGKARHAEHDSVAVLAKYLRRDLASDDWAAKRLLETTLVRRDLARIVRALRSGREGDVFAVLLAAREAGTGTAASLLGSGLTAANFRVTDRDAVAALARMLTDTLASADLRILRAAEDAYRSIIAQATASGLEGEFTRRAAAQSALNTFADRGITGFIDSAGRAWSLPSYTEMACRTSAMNAGRQGVLDATRAAGRDLVIIGGSAGGCPLCEPWEGEVLSLDGTTPGYSTFDEAEGAGLFHANCTHVPYPYVEGLTDVTKGVQHSDPERYVAEQRQRTMERHVRQWKTRQAAALDDATAQKASAKVSEWQAALRDHVATNDLPRLYYREQIDKAI